MTPAPLSPAPPSLPSSLLSHLGFLCPVTHPLDWAACMGCLRPGSSTLGRLSPSLPGAVERWQRPPAPLRDPSPGRDAGRRGDWSRGKGAGGRGDLSALAPAAVSLRAGRELRAPGSAPRGSSEPGASRQGLSSRTLPLRPDAPLQLPPTP